MNMVSSFLQDRSMVVEVDGGKIHATSFVVWCPTGMYPISAVFFLCLSMICVRVFVAVGLKSS
jgi:hypothetical protein